MSIDGILNVNKPQGKTSFQMVSLVRQWSGERRVGHAGTLDPLASGVLPICLGRGTRVVEFLAASDKSYRAEIELGVATDTYDAWGRATSRGDPSAVSLEQLKEVLASFQGAIEQKPPMYSAARHKGKRLYELARAGIDVEREARKSHISRLELVSWELPLITIEVDCSKGTYIRSLAHDLGQALGCGAHLKNLVRLRCGLFHLEEALSISQLEEAFHLGCWQSLLYPIDTVLLSWRAAILNEESERAIRKGQPISHQGSQLAAGGTGLPLPGTRCRAYSLDGRFLAVLHFEEEKGLWQPEKVFLPA